MHRPPHHRFVAAPFLLAAYARRAGTVLRSHGIGVHAADSLQAARFLWQPCASMGR